MLSIHGLLAAFIAFDEAFADIDGRYAAWKATWPSLKDFKASMPSLWPERCRAQWIGSASNGLVSNQDSSHGSMENDEKTSYEDSVRIIPSSMTKLLEAQAARYRQDYETTVTIIPSAKSAHQRCHQSAVDSFKYAWCIVNTRCLYFNPPQPSHQSLHQGNTPLAQCTTSEILPSELHDSNQHMVLCPPVDLFNHTSSSQSACTVTHDLSGFTVTSRKAYPSEDGDDDEIFASYGPHSNDFLLVEYGFILPDDENIHDSISLDSVILTTLSEEQKGMLEAKGYWGEYTLFAPAANGGLAGVCWRTEVAARVGILSREEWEGFVDGLLDEDELGGGLQDRAVAVIHAWVGEVKKEVERSVRSLREVGEDQQRLMEVFGDEVHTEGESEIARSTSNQSKTTDTTSVESDSSIRIAKRRLNLVLERCRQILHICHAFLHQTES